MTDFSRPNSQWTDLPSTASALTPWRFTYSATPSTHTYTLESGTRRRMGTGLIKTGEVTTEKGTTVTWAFVEQVNGEPEAGVTALNGVVHIDLF